MAEPLLRFVHMSDTHITPDTSYTAGEAPYTPLYGAQEIVRQINALPFVPDFVLHTGDVAYDPDPDVYDAVAGLLAEVRFPLYVIGGNHDHLPALQRTVMGRTPEQMQAYPHYEFTCGGVQVVCVDSNAPSRPPSGWVSEGQLQWLDAICSASDDRPLVIAVHHNPVPAGVPWLDDWMRMRNGEDFHRIIRQAGSRLRGVFHGHIHQNIDVFYDGVLYVSAASSWRQFMSYPIPENDRVSADPAPPGFNVVTVTADRTYIRRHSFVVDAPPVPPAESG